MQHFKTRSPQEQTERRQAFPDTGVELPLLTGIAAYCVWPHRHRARMHLLIISLLKSRRDLAVPKLSPPLCLSEPLPAVLGVCFSALTTQQLHRTAINDIAHGSPQ
jgi:hypothetical protein